VTWVDCRRSTTSVDYNLNKLSLILVRMVDALCANKHQWQPPGSRRFWRTLDAGNIRDIPCACVRMIYVYLVSRYPCQMLSSCSSDFAMSVCSLFLDNFMLIANKFEYFVLVHVLLEHSFKRFMNCFQLFYAFKIRNK